MTDAGYSCGKYGIDGSYGKDTLAAVNKFKKDHGLKADGTVDSRTLKALNKDTSGRYDTYLNDASRATKMQKPSAQPVKENKRDNSIKTDDRGTESNYYAEYYSNKGVGSSFNNNVEKGISNNYAESVVDPELQDKCILSKVDMASVTALKATYITRAVINDTDGMKAILRTIDTIRCKPEYNGKYSMHDSNGNCLNTYSYNNSDINTNVVIHAENITNSNILAHDNTVVNAALTAGSIFLPNVYSAMCGLVSLGSTDAPSSVDYLLTVGGMIKGTPGKFFRF